MLASKSPRRKELLKLINLDFSVHCSNYEERNGDRDPVRLVIDHAVNKARDVAEYYQDSWIIGADTIVVKDNQILGKPQNKEEARKMLQILSGVTHQVYTGYCIMNSKNGKYLTNYEKTDVTFIGLSDEMITYYIENFQVYDKAGSYAIQDFSSVFVKKIDGCFYNVVGFPVASFCSMIGDLNRIR